MTYMRKLLSFLRRVLAWFFRYTPDDDEGSRQW